MGNHRAPRRGAQSATPGTPVGTTPDSSSAGKRRAVKHAGLRGPLFRGLPSAPVLLGLAALTMSATGAVTLNHSDVATAVSPSLELTSAANALSGESVVASTSAKVQRKQAVSRDSRRDALQDASTERLQEAAEAVAKERNAELIKLAKSAEKHAAVLETKGWTLPIAGYRLTARFGQSSGLWARSHPGLDFAAPTGRPEHGRAACQGRGGASG